MKFLNNMDGASKILEDSSHRFVTDTEKAAWNAKQAAITGGASSIVSSDLSASRALVSSTSGKVAVSGITLSELERLDGARSNLQDQIDAKASSTHAHSLFDLSDVYTVAQMAGHVLSYDGTEWRNTTPSGAGLQEIITGGATSITSSNLTASRALISDASGKVAVSAVTSTELGYLTGVTSAIQTQLNGKAATSHTHSYLPLTGGSITGDISLNNGVAIKGTSSYGVPNYNIAKTGSNANVEIGDKSLTLDLNSASGNVNINYTVGSTPTATKILTEKDVNGGVTSILSNNLTASRALVSDASGKVAVSAVTSTQLGYLSGVTSAIQTQLNGKAASSHTHSYLPLTGGTITGSLTLTNGDVFNQGLLYNEAGKITSSAITKDDLEGFFLGFNFAESFEQIRYSFATYGEFYDFQQLVVNEYSHYTHTHSSMSLTGDPLTYASTGITGVNNAPFNLPTVNVGTTARFIPFGHMAAMHSQGYVSHLSFGLYKSTAAWTNGFFIGLGGADANPTEYYMFNHGGSVQHSSGLIYMSSQMYVNYDHTSASSPRAVGVIMGTGNPPTASTVPQGTIYLKYV